MEDRNPSAASGFSRGLKTTLITLTLFGVVFGYLEAAAVVYIRVMYEPIHQRLFPDRAPGDLFPFFSFEQWGREGPKYAQNPPLEIGREIGTVIIVALVALALLRTVRHWTACFFLAFGVWIWFYYFWLKMLIGWPHSLFDWDLIFTVPLPWVGPVAASLLSGLAMVAASGCFFWREAVGKSMRPGWLGWTAVAGGSFVVMVAFCWDIRNIMKSGYPNPFTWWVLALGLGICFVGVGVAWRRGNRTRIVHRSA